MRTFARNDRQRGLTLMEALMTLAILGLGAMIAASAFNARSPRIAVDYAASELISDLKRARLVAQTTGTALTVAGSHESYNCPEADISRRLPAGVTAEWNDRPEGAVGLASGFAQNGATIRLHKGNAASVVRIARFTGRITCE